MIAIVVGIVWGTPAGGYACLSSFLPLAWFALNPYVNVFRSIPLVVMVLLWFYLIVPGFLQNVLGLSPKTDIRLISAMVAFSRCSEARLLFRSSPRRHSEHLRGQSSARWRWG